MPAVCASGRDGDHRQTRHPAGPRSPRWPG